MTSSRNEPSSDPQPTPALEAEASVNTSRRFFLRGAAIKAIYVTPAVLTLSASHAVAGSAGDFNSGCVDAGSVTQCASDDDCCGALTCDTFGAKDCS